MAAPVSIAVVSYNTRELLERCLSSLAPSVKDGTAEVVVLDNASEDGSAELAKEVAPWATVIEPGANLGFGRAVNRAARESASEWLAVANADVELEPGALDAMREAGANRLVGAVAPRLILPDGSTQESVGPLPTIPLALIFNSGIYRVLPALGDHHCLPGFWNPERPRAVPWAVGAFLMVRRSAFEEVGGFDERQWMYAEDLDLCWRLGDAGWRVCYAPQARVKHVSGASTLDAFGPDPVARYMRETYAVILRRRGRLRTHITAALNVLGAAARLAWLTPASLVVRRLRGPRAACRLWLSAHLQGLESPERLLGER